MVTLGKKYHTNTEEQCYVNMSREELASLAGTATESLIRTLTEFKQERLIEIDNGIIIIPSEKRLQCLIR